VSAIVTRTRNWSSVRLPIKVFSPQQSITITDAFHHILISIEHELLAIYSRHTISLIHKLASGVSLSDIFKDYCHD
jgi:uncharacterized protein YxjI